MVKITFPDGSVKEFAAGTTAYQIAESISPRLAADSLAASVNGATVDLSRPIDEDASVKFYKWEDEEGQARLLAHLVAPAGRSARSALPRHQVRHRPGHRERLLLRRRLARGDHRIRPSENRSQDGGAGPSERAARPPRGSQGRSAQRVHREGRPPTRSN